MPTASSESVHSGSARAELQLPLGALGGALGGGHGGGEGGLLHGAQQRAARLEAYRDRYGGAGADFHPLLRRIKAQRFHVAGGRDHVGTGRVAAVANGQLAHAWLPQLVGVEVDGEIVEGQNGQRPADGGDFLLLFIEQEQLVRVAARLGLAVARGMEPEGELGLVAGHERGARLGEGHPTGR